MPPVPGSYNWTQITEMEDGMADRMSREALFLVGGLPEEPDTEPGETFDYRDALGFPRQRRLSPKSSRRRGARWSSERRMPDGEPGTWGSLLKSWGQ